MQAMSVDSHHQRPGAPSWSTHADEALSRRGSRASTARHAVLAALDSQACCASAQEIHARITTDGTAIGIASVYRTLELLHGLALITRVDTGDGVARYEPTHPNGEHHHHLVCNTCGAVEAFHDGELEAAIHAVADRVDFRVDAHDIALRGACRRCR